MHEWSTKVKCTYQLDGNMFVVVQVLPCSVEEERERRERERERERKGGEIEVTHHSEDSLAQITAPEMRVTPLIRRLMMSAEIRT